MGNPLFTYHHHHRWWLYQYHFFMIIKTWILIWHKFYVHILKEKILSSGGGSGHYGFMVYKHTPVPFPLSASATNWFVHGRQTVKEKWQKKKSLSVLLDLWLSMSLSNSNVQPLRSKRQRFYGTFRQLLLAFFSKSPWDFKCGMKCKMEFEKRR